VKNENHVNFTSQGEI